MEKLRLQVYLSRSGVASRRASAELIENGRVTVNKNQITEPGFRVGEDDIVKLDGTVVQLEEEKIYLAFNKPPKVICTAKDPEGRLSVFDIVSESYPALRLFTVGRLDYMSTGLLLITNDGDFANLLSHPRSGVIKKYRVECKTEISRTLLDDWKKGIRVKGELYRLVDYYFDSPRSVVLSLAEGKNREIRNVFAHGRTTIKSLNRIQFGSLTLGNIKPGRFRNLSSKEIDELHTFAAKNKKGGSRISGKEK